MNCCGASAHELLWSADNVEVLKRPLKDVVESTVGCAKRILRELGVPT